MRGRKKSRKKFSALMEKLHDEAVEKIAEEPEVLRIEGLNSKTLVYRPIKFPELKKKGKETGDLILIWLSAPQEWEIVVLEVTVGIRQHFRRYFPRLEMSFKYFKSHWREWLKSIGLDLPKNHSLWVRTVVVGYGGKCLWEEPFKSERRIKIF